MPPAAWSPVPTASRAERYVDRLDDEIDRELEGGLFFETGTDLVSDVLKERIKKLIRSRRQTRFQCEIWKDPDVRERFSRFYLASSAEIDKLNRENNYGIPTPETLLFGHTHCPLGIHDSTTGLESVRVE